MLDISGKTPILSLEQRIAGLKDIPVMDITAADRADSARFQELCQYFADRNAAGVVALPSSGSLFLIPRNSTSSMAMPNFFLRAFLLAL